MDAQFNLIVEEFYIDLSENRYDQARECIDKMESCIAEMLQYIQNPKGNAEDTVNQETVSLFKQVSPLLIDVIDR